MLKNASVAKLVTDSGDPRFGMPTPDDADLARILDSRYRAHGPRLQFLIRRLDALARLSVAVSEYELVKASRAISDHTPLLLALIHAQSAKEAATGEPELAKARLRGISVRGRLLAAEGGALSAPEVFARTGIPMEVLDDLRRKKRVVAVRVGRAPYAYPTWQFDANGVLRGLDSVLAELQESDPWMRISFFVDSNVMLNDRTPLSVLRRGHLAPVKRAARAFGEQGAA